MLTLDIHADMTDIVDSLPVLNGDVLRLLELVGDPTSGSDDISDVLMRDGTATGELLAEANSTAHGINHPVDSVAEAVTRLGTLRVVLLVMRLQSRNATSSLTTRPDRIAVLENHQMYAIETAIALAKRLEPGLRGSLATTAVLHDMGHAVIMEYATRTGEEAVIDALHDVSAEAAYYDLHHGEVGRVICDHWSIPEHIGIAVQHHHSPLEDPLSNATYLVDLISHVAAAPDGDEPGLNDPQVATSLDVLGLTETSVAEVIRDVRSRLSA